MSMAWPGMKSVRAAVRANKIGRVLIRYRLDALLEDTPAGPWLRLARPFVPRARAVSYTHLTLPTIYSV